MYEIVLMDADRTLFDFDKGEEEALKETFAFFDIFFDENVLII